MATAQRKRGARSRFIWREKLWFWIAGFQLLLGVFNVLLLVGDDSPTAWRFLVAIGYPVLALATSGMPFVLRRDRLRRESRPVSES
jgi:hypothetical protein